MTNTNKLHNNIDIKIVLDQVKKKRKQSKAKKQSNKQKKELEEKLEKLELGLKELSNRKTIAQSITRMPLQTQIPQMPSLGATFNFAEVSNIINRVSESVLEAFEELTSELRAMGLNPEFIRLIEERARDVTEQQTIGVQTEIPQNPRDLQEDDYINSGLIAGGLDAQEIPMRNNAQEIREIPTPVFNPQEIPTPSNALEPQEIPMSNLANGSIPQAMYDQIFIDRNTSPSPSISIPSSPLQSIPSSPVRYIDSISDRLPDVGVENQAFGDATSDSFGVEGQSPYEDVDEGAAMTQMANEAMAEFDVEQYESDKAAEMAKFTEFFEQISLKMEDVQSKLAGTEFTGDGLDEIAKEIADMKETVTFYQRVASSYADTTGESGVKETIEGNIEGVLDDIGRIEQIYRDIKANNRGLTEVAKYVKDFREERSNSSNSGGGDVWDDVPDQPVYKVIDAISARDLNELEIPWQVQNLEDFPNLFQRMLKLGLDPKEIKNVFKASVPLGSGNTLNDITEELFAKSVMNAVELKDSDKTLNIKNLRNPQMAYIMKRLIDK